MLFIQTLVEVYAEIIIPFTLLIITVLGAVGLFLFLPFEIIEKIKNGKIVAILIILDYVVLMPVFFTIILMVAKLLGGYDGNNTF